MSDSIRKSELTASFALIPMRHDAGAAVNGQLRSFSTRLFTTSQWRESSSPSELHYTIRESQEMLWLLDTRFANTIPANFERGGKA